MASTPSVDSLEVRLEIAAEHATVRVPVAGRLERVGDVRDALVGEIYDCVDDVAVLDADALVGIVPIERLLAAPADARIADVMETDPPVVAPGADQEQVAWSMVRRGESSVAVVQADGTFAGLIPPHRMIAVLLAEHDEDLARLGGYVAGTTRARSAAEEPVARRLWHRLPWLLIGLVGAMASAVIVGAFEEQLSTNVLLAFFVPGVVYMADAVGTQTETVLIRGLSAGVSVHAVARRELFTGAIVGLTMAAAFLPFALLGWGDEQVAVAVSLALLASCSIATIVAMALPWLFQRAGIDPAFGSGPLATVVQDLLSIAVYFAIAVPLAS
jgi:magnesium transporter